MDEFDKMEANMAAQFATQVEDPRKKRIEELSEAKKEAQKLDEKERAAVEEFATRIDIVDSDQVANYGHAAQQNLNTFTESVLNEVRTKDAGQAGDLIASVVAQLNDCQFDSSNVKGIKRFFNKGKNFTETMKAKYDSVSANVDKVTEELRGHVSTLYRDLDLYDKMYDQNKAYYKELTLYIIAGKLKLEAAREEAQKMYERAQISGSQEDAQEYRDFTDAIDRFEKRIIDLETTKAITLQMAPQIRMLQSTDFGLIDKIQSTLTNTIPLWKSQLIILLGEQNSQRAIEAQKLVSNITNQMLKKNAESLHMISVETAKELERGIVDVETLKETNKQLIQTLDDVSKIKKEGRAKRAQTEQELEKIEQELKDKLLSVTPDGDINMKNSTSGSDNKTTSYESPFKLVL